MVPVSEFDADESEEPQVKRLTAAQAQELREREPSLSPWRVVSLQVVVSLLVALIAWVFTGQSSAAWSAGYGGLAVVIPAALFARGLMSRFSSINAATAWLGFFIWEAVKMAVSIGMLFAAPKLITDLNWLAMLMGLIVTLKVYWVALLMRPKRKTI